MLLSGCFRHIIAPYCTLYRPCSIFQEHMLIPQVLHSLPLLTPFPSLTSFLYSLPFSKLHALSSFYFSPFLILVSLSLSSLFYSTSPFLLSPSLFLPFPFFCSLFSTSPFFLLLLVSFFTILFPFFSVILLYMSPPLSSLSFQC